MIINKCLRRPLVKGLLENYLETRKKETKKDKKIQFPDTDVSLASHRILTLHQV
jgi:hypothetical protein